MRLALRELRRTPGRFLVATVTISLIAVLLMFLGALLDELIRLSTGSIQAQRGQIVVVSNDSRGVLAASRIQSENRRAATSAVDAVAGPDATVGGYGEVALGARLKDGDERELTAVRVRGYELAAAGLPRTPPTGDEVWADPDLVGDFEVGDVIQLGSGRAEVTIVGFLDPSQTPSRGGVWGSLDTWRTALASARPGSTVPPDFVQGLIVDVGSAGENAVPATIDAIEAESGLAAYTIAEASNAIPGVSAQRTTFNQIIAVTTVIGLVVIALFFALLTAERTSLYGVLKAVGARSSVLFAGVAAQAVAIVLVASIIGIAMMAAAAVGIPPGSLPFAVTPTRIAGSVGLLLAAAIAGSIFSLRTVLRIDPAKAIGGN